MQKIGVQIIFLSLVITPMFLGVSFGMKEGEPDFSFNRIDHTVLMRDYTKGTIERREICFDQETCETDKVLYYGDAVKDSFMILKKYKTGGTYTISVMNYGEKEQYERLYFIKPETNIQEKTILSGIYILALPKPKLSKNQISFSLSQNDQHKIALYVQDLEEEPFKNGFLDMDVSVDSDQDGIFDNDEDIVFNQPVLREYDEKLGEVFGKIHFERDGKKYEKNLMVTFEDGKIPEQFQTLYEKISKLFKSISSTDEYRKLFKIKLDLLRRNLGDNESTLPLLQECVDLIEQKKVLLSKDQQALFDDIFHPLASEEMLKANITKEYQYRKQHLINFFPYPKNLEVKSEIVNFEEQQESLKKEEKLDALLDLFSSFKAKVIKEKNYQEKYEPELVSAFCTFFTFYEIPLQHCSKEDFELLFIDQKERGEILKQEQEEKLRKEQEEIEKQEKFLEEQKQQHEEKSNSEILEEGKEEAIGEEVSLEEDSPLEIPEEMNQSSIYYILSKYGILPLALILYCGSFIFLVHSSFSLKTD